MNDCTGKKQPDDEIQSFAAGYSVPTAGTGMDYYWRPTVALHSVCDAGAKRAVAVLR